MMSYSVEQTQKEQSSLSTDLYLEFDIAEDQKTYISNQYCRYPFHICKVQYLDDFPEGLATIYLQSSSGGIFEDDQLVSHVRVNEGAQAHITTQASTIVHSMNNKQAKQTLSLETETGSYLEFLPEPLILFPRSHLRSQVHIQHHPESVLLYCDGFCQHDPGSQSARFDTFHSELTVYNQQMETLCLDRYTVSGNIFSAGIPGVMGNCTIQLTFVVLANNSMIEELQELLRSTDSSSQTYIGISVLPNDCGILVRVIATEAYEAKQTTHRIWVILRERLLGQPPSPRRK